MYKDKTCFVLGSAGFIGGHLCRYLQDRGANVIGIDIKPQHKFWDIPTRYCNEYISQDLIQFDELKWFIRSRKPHYIYQLAANMGGMGFISGEHDAEIMNQSALININVAKTCVDIGFDGKLFFSSSACIYGKQDNNNPSCPEHLGETTYPSSDYGLEKRFSEQMYLAFKRNNNLNVKIARFHNIFGPLGSFDDGKEKAPAALCRKVILAQDDGVIEVWGTGSQTRSFLYIDECLHGIDLLMQNDFGGPVNIGSDKFVTMNQLAQIIINISGKKLTIKNIHQDSPLVGVQGRNSENTLIKEKLGWAPTGDLGNGLTITYNWIKSQLEQK